MALLDAAKINKGYLTVLVDHRINRENSAHKLHNVHQHAVQGISIQDAIGSPAMFEDPGGMQDPDRILMSHTGCDQLSSARVAGHEMRFHQSDNNAQIRKDKAAVKFYGDIAGQGPQGFMILFIAGKMIDHRHGVQDPVAAYQFTEFFVFIRPMQTCGNQDGNSLRLDAGPDQFLHKHR